jgi:hypothetical protein
LPIRSIKTHGLPWVFVVITADDDEPLFLFASRSYRFHAVNSSGPANLAQLFRSKIAAEVKVAQSLAPQNHAQPR